MRGPWSSLRDIKNHTKAKYLEPLYVHPSYKKLTERIAEVFILAGLVSLAFSIFSLQTILSFLFFSASLVIFIKITLNKYQTKGIINCLPPCMRRVMLERSIFDILCDLWFFQKIGLYLQYLIGPFIIKISPEEIVEHLNELGPQTKKMILTKGLVNLFPKSVRSLVVPKAKKQSERLEKGSTMPLQHFDYDTDTNTKNDSHAGSPSTSLINKESVSTRQGKRKISDDSSDEIVMRKTPQQKEKEEFEKRCMITKAAGGKAKNVKGIPSVASLTLQGDVLNNEKSLGFLEQFEPFERNSDLEITSTKSLLANKKVQRVKKRDSYTNLRAPGASNKSFENLKLDEIKTITLASSTMMKENKEKRKQDRSSGTETDVVVNENWDNIELYKRKQQMLIEKKKTHDFKGSLGIISKLIAIKNGGIVSVISGKSLFKLFIVSSAGLLFQLRISRRARAWLPNSIVMVFYILTIIFSSGSLLFVLAKYLKDKRNSNNKSIEDKK